MPAPSPITNPSRPASNGRDAFSGSSFRTDSAFMLLNPATASGVMAASAPPVIMVSAVPCWIRRKASPMAWADEAHAETVA